MAEPYTIISGCMFAGKTRTLLSMYRQTLRRHGKDRVLLIKYKFPMSYSRDKIISWLGYKAKALPFGRLLDIPPVLLRHARYIFVDDLHFFPDFLEFVEKVTRDYPRLNYVLALAETDSEGRIPEKIQSLLDRKLRRIQLYAQCECGRPASYTRCKEGSSHLYQSLCVDCFMPPALF